MIVTKFLLWVKKWDDEANKDTWQEVDIFDSLNLLSAEVERLLETEYAGHAFKWDMVGSDDFSNF